MHTQTAQTPDERPDALLRMTAMRVDDLAAVDALERASFASPWPQQVYLRELTRNPFSFYKTVRPTSAGARRKLPPILAYGGCWVMDDEAHVMTVASHPAYRRCRLGEWVVLALIGDAIQRAAAAATLEVRVGNHGAIKLYEKLGFVRAGRRRGYYPPTREKPREDALIMTLSGLDHVAVQQRFYMRLREVEREAQDSMKREIERLRD